MKRLMITALLIAPAMLFALTAEEIIELVDDNNTFGTQEFSATMTIEKNNRTLVKEFNGYGTEEDETFFMEYTNPEDEGVKYLKIDDEMWIYFPDADDVMKISGHLLSQSMMGSDLSYEDMMNNEELLDEYDATLIGETNVNSTDCYEIQLDAIVDDVTYEKEILFIDKTHYVPIKIDLYAKGGRLVKSMEMSDYETIGSHYFANTITIQDMRKANSITTIEYDSVAFDTYVDDDVFTLQYLQR